MAIGPIQLITQAAPAQRRTLPVDRIRRKRPLMLSILTYSVCSFASGLSTSVLTLAVLRLVPQKSKASTTGARSTQGYAARRGTIIVISK
jgi:MFS family permease